MKRPRMARRPRAPGAALSAKEQSLKEQRAASLSLMLLAMVGATYASSAEATIVYGGPATLTITPEQASVQVGTPLTADVGFSGLQQQLIGSYDLTLTWNPALLSFSSVSFGSFLDAPNSLQDFNATAGSLEVGETSLGSLANQSGFGSIPLFDVTFDSLAAGTSPLAFNTVANGDLSGLTVGDDIGNTFTNFVTVDSSVVITAPAGSGTGPMMAPEMDVASAGSALTLFVGGVLVLSGRRSIRVPQKGASKL
jgi:cohesin domain-containing protein